MIRVWEEAATGLRIVAMIGLMFLLTGCGGGEPESTLPPAQSPTALVALIPSGEVERVSAFRWSSELAAASYRLVVLNPGGQPVLTHETPELNYALNAGEMSVFEPGGYSWSVEARDANGEVIATSRTQLFDVR